MTRSKAQAMAELSRAWEVKIKTRSTDNGTRGQSRVQTRKWSRLPNSPATCCSHKRKSDNNGFIRAGICAMGCGAWSIFWCVCPSRGDEGDSVREWEQ